MRAKKILPIIFLAIAFFVWCLYYAHETHAAEVDINERFCNNSAAYFYQLMQGRFAYNIKQEQAWDYLYYVNKSIPPIYREEINSYIALVYDVEFPVIDNLATIAAYASVERQKCLDDVK